MKKAFFGSRFKEDMLSFLELRINSTARNTYRLDLYRLSSFDSFLTDISFEEEVVPQELINDWIARNNVPKASINGYIKTVRGFMKYRINLGKLAYTPPYLKQTDLYIPYIFSSEELVCIFQEADSVAQIKPYANVPYVNIEIAILLRLLYCCGLRLGEALNLKVRDVDLSTGVLRILHTKLDKQRTVPIHDSMKFLLYEYICAMKLFGNGDTYIFSGMNPGAPLSQLTAERHFKSILKSLSIITGCEDIHKRGPCLHCLRHCFMLSSFRQLEKAGYAIDMASPYLSVYCGHESLLESEKYMKFSSEMFDDEMNRFADFITPLFPEVDYD